ncbi:type II secretion system protein GspG [Candidatus Dependentiae bacterium]|nr:type II secretion system protein GspG [Candidatus Dependentiae bacterium]
MIFQKSSAFTMIEILIVLAIIGFLFAFLGPTLYRRIAQSDVALTKLKMGKVKDALVEYKNNVGHYPTKREGGLRALIEKPQGVENWNGPYLDSEDDLLDKWGNELELNIPPVKSKKFRYLEIISYGADGQEGGIGENAEIIVGG